MRLIYITNTRLPSEKANSYQSIQMCHSFAKFFDNVEMWVPIANNTKDLNEVKNVCKYYGVEQNFSINKLFQFDSKFLKYLNEFIWANTKGAVFALNVIINLFKYRKNVDTIIYTRDWYILLFFIGFKKIGIFKNKIFYESHSFKKKLLSFFEKADGIVVINLQLKKLFFKYGINNVYVAHDGVNLDTFKAIDKSYAFNLLSFDSESKYIIYVGRFNTLGKEKGIPQIIESLKYIDNEVKVIFLGGPLDDIINYYKLALDNNIDKKRVIFIDRQPVSELYKYIGISSIVLMPFPWTEHYAYYMSPLKMFEYMGTKRPIIASKLPSIMEVLKDKENAILCEPDDPKDLADKINWILNNDCSKIVNRAYKDVKKYTWDKRAENIKNFMTTKLEKI